MRKLLYPSALFLALALLILLPALRPGQLFLLDMPWPQHFYLSTYIQHGVSAQFPITFILAVLNFGVPAWLLQKLLLLSLLTFCGLGMFLLQKRLNVLSTAFSLCSGVLYMLNPYVLDRLMAGQWLVLAGYAFLPFFALLVLRAYHAPTKRTIAWAVLAWTVYPIFSIHYWYIVTLFLLPAVAYKAYISLQHRRKAKLTINRAWIAASLIIGLWLVLLAVRYTRLTSQVGAPDFVAFATRPIDILGAWGAVLSLRGFWYSGGVIPQSVELLWLLLCGVFVSLTIYALFILRRRHPLWALYTGASFLCAVLLAVGYGSPISQWFTDVVRHVVPGYSGMRETQKIVGLIAFAYALAVPLALQHIWQSAKARAYTLPSAATGIAMYGLCMLLALGVAYPAFHPHHYPQAWQQANRLLIKAHAKRMLILPWNGYLHLPFADNAFVADPAGRYFGVPTEARRNSGNQVLDNAHGDSTFDNQVLSLKKNPSAITAIRAQGYDYIVLLHTEDYMSYQEHLDATGIDSVFSSDSLTLYSTDQHLLDQSF